MAFVPLALASAGWFLGSYAYNLKQEAKKSLVVEQPQDEEPFFGAIGYASQMSFVNHKGVFRSVTEDTDAQGATIFLVDYGNGCKIQQYNDPRILL